MKHFWETPGIEEKPNSSLHVEAYKLHGW